MNTTSDDCIFGCVVVGGAIVSILVGKIFHESWYLCCAMSITALFGFPGTVIVPTEVTKAAAETEDEKKLIQGSIMPKMIISGMACGFTPNRD